MATTTGNVKISQLTRIAKVQGGEIVPISYSVNNNDQYESYNMTIDQVRQYMGTALGIETSGGQTPGIKDQLNAYIGQVNRIQRDFAQYNEETRIITLAGTGKQDNKYVSHVTKSLQSNGAMGVSAPVEMKQGCIYLLPVDAVGNVPSDCSWFSKKVDHTYHTVTGTKKETHIVDGKEIEVIVEEWGEDTETIYEPLTNHYHEVSTGGFGTPTKKYIAFFATEDETVVISTLKSKLAGTEEQPALIQVNYGLLTDIAEEFLGIDSDLMKVLVEAVAKNSADIKSVSEKVNDFGDAHGVSLDLDNYLAVKGSPMVIVKDRDPEGQTTIHGAEIPNMLGQIWINTTDEKVFVATHKGNIGGWKQIAVAGQGAAASVAEYTTDKEVAE